MRRRYRMYGLDCALVILAAASAASSAAGNETTTFFKEHRSAIDVEQRGDAVLFANRHVGVAFRQSDSGFVLERIYGIALEQDYFLQGKPTDVFQIVMTLDPKHIRKDDRHNIRMGHFVIMDQMAGEDFDIGSSAAKSVSWRREGNDSESTLYLEWKGIDLREEKGVLDVTVTVRLRADAPLSYWRISISNRSSRYGIERVRFPVMTLAPIGDADDNRLLYPRYRGGLIAKPFQDGYNDLMFYPHNFNMQFQALYNQTSNKGIYLGTRDPASSFMCYDIRRRNELISYRPGHFPPNITFSGEDYAMPYDFVAGLLQGDWYDACHMYRQWAVKQFWCRKGKLSVRPDIPKWYKEAPLFFYTTLGDSAEGPHSLQENLRLATAHFREFLEWAGVPLPLNLYQVTKRVPGLTCLDLPVSVYRAPRLGRWAGFSSHETHCGNYPDIPVLPELSAECKRLRELGGMVCPYVPLEFFDPGPSENAPTLPPPNPTRCATCTGQYVPGAPIQIGRYVTGAIGGALKSKKPAC